ncbi:GLUG motif-containing protein [Natronobeatus ordinarius]|uniref:GLUG motif-containing protein n=1 Tax=Natronobeatus ordinarius TaxID=2963433 RepID=UPI0020CEAC8E|nr:GLUG motif-containing protein [Natronobeatus ordinarius]
MERQNESKRRAVAGTRDADQRTGRKAGASESISRRTALTTIGVGLTGAVVGFSGTVSADEFAGGSGTEQDPYQIETWGQLENVTSNMDDQFVLIDDLDEETAGYDDYAAPSANGGEGWDPIGTSTWRFDGTLDGNGHTISGLAIDRTGTGDDYIGLFANIGFDGEVTNLHVDVPGVTGRNNVGIIAGGSGGEITDCSANGAVTAEDQYQADFAGGLVGRNDGSIVDSHATGPVTGDITVGGLVGKNNGSITNASATGIVEGAMSFLGGLVGENTGTISKSWATGDVSDIDLSWTSTGVGGLVGKNSDDGVIENSYARGSATINGNDNVGALVGENVQQAEIRTSYATGAASGPLANEGGVAGLNQATVEDVYYNSDVMDSAFGEVDGGTGSGTGLSTDEMQGASAEDEMDDLDFDGTWTTTDGYPELAAEDDDESPLEPYTNEDGVVETDGLRDAIDNWRGSEIDTDLLRDVIDAWRSGDPVS